MPDVALKATAKTPHAAASVLAVQTARPALLKKAIADRSPAELRKLQGKMGLGKTFGRIEVPLDWMPDGSLRTLSARSVDFQRLLPEGVLPDSIEGCAILSPAVKAALTMRFFDHLRPRSHGASLQTSTWVQYVRYVAEIAAIGLASRHDSEAPLFAHLSSNDLEKFAKDAGRIACLGLLAAIHRDGHLPDWPDPPPAREGDAPEEVQDGDLPLNGDSKPPPKKYQPLPDIFVQEAGRRAVWFIEQLGPALLDCIQACNSNSLLATSSSQRQYARQKIIQAWQWRTPAGQPINTLPFVVLFGENAAPIQWCVPDRSVRSARSGTGVGTYKQLCVLLTVLQASHLFATSLAFGERHSEQASLRIGSIVESASGDEYAQGKTYKLTFRRGGATQHWPLSDLTVRAIEQQERLSLIVRGVRKRAGDPLWVKLSTTGGNKHGMALNADPTLLSVNTAYEAFVRALDLERYLTKEDPRVSQHRFRKTLARLIAIALVNSQEVLMMFFGHRAIEMTLQYIQTDRELQAEITELANNLMILNGVRIVEHIDIHGGPAAKRINEFVQSQKARLGIEVLNESQLIEGAITLTAGGRVGNLVRPGVICMKLPNELGPCTGARGIPDSARCRPDCMNRLELGEAKHRQDVEAILVKAVETWEVARSENDELKAAWAAGQICLQLRRFPDIEERWSRNPTVACVIAESATGMRSV